MSMPWAFQLHESNRILVENRLNLSPFVLAFNIKNPSSSQGLWTIKECPNTHGLFWPFLLGMTKPKNVQRLAQGHSVRKYKFGAGKPASWLPESYKSHCHTLCKIENTLHITEHNVCLDRSPFVPPALLSPLQWRTSQHSVLSQSCWGLRMY